MSNKDGYSVEGFPVPFLPRWKYEEENMAAVLIVKTPPGFCA